MCLSQQMANCGVLFLLLAIHTGAEVFIGRFPSLAHGLQGEVLVLNDRQFRIKGFAYDGQGKLLAKIQLLYFQKMWDIRRKSLLPAPAVWFMGMKNGTQGVYSAEGVALPNHKGTCLNYQRAYRNADITITLPRRLRVYDLEALSLYCFQYCHNFGHVRIPRNIRIPPAPANLPSLNQCYPKYPACRNRARFL